MASESNEQLHFVMFPFMASGHMIPMIDIAKLLAQHGALVTIITTPLNAARFKETLNRARDSGLPINVIEIKFPAEEAGLPKDCENPDMLPSLRQYPDFCLATKLMQEPVIKLLEEMKPRPSCIISDLNLPYTSHVATKLQLPRIVFNGISCLCMLVIHIVASLKSQPECISIPGMPPNVQLTKQQFPGAFIEGNDAFFAEMMAAEETTRGIIVNSFEELEPEYVQEYRKILEGYKVWCIPEYLQESRKRTEVYKAWCVGPVSLNSKHNMDMLQRGNKASNRDFERCLKWLDNQQPESVLYVCFGSVCNLVTLQLIELALGLEASNKPFVWAIRGGEKSKELEKWIEEQGFEERTKGRSFIIRGWAPQLVILSHKAIGGFFTHCGWNSTLEAISAGVPMITWPLFADQFCNEKQVVDVLKIGVKVGAEVTLVWGQEDKIGVTVKREDVAKGVMKLMEEGEEAEERRKRSKELSEKANKAVEPNGSSYLNLKKFIEDIKQLAKNSN